MSKALTIALLIETGYAYPRDLLRGIAAYAHTHGPWTFYAQRRDIGGAALAFLRSGRFDGILARIETRKMVSQLRRIGLPTVDLYGVFDVQGIPAFDNDNQAIARAAFEELREKGCERFAFCGYAGLHFSEQRCTHFVAHAAAAGFETSVFQEHLNRDAANYVVVEAWSLWHQRALVKWLRSLPKPVGLMACNDVRAQQVLTLCRECDIRVPEQVAVIGVDNDETVCELSDPTLSSVDPNARQVGYEGAALLDRMIGGESPPRGKTLFKPSGAVIRRSTDVLAIADADIAAAVHFVRKHACEGIDVDDVVAEVHLSRSTLERRFASLLGRSPRDEIRRVQLLRVEELLARTNFPLEKIAHIAGFHHVESMCRLFKHATGQTPGKYRQTSRA